MWVRFQCHRKCNRKLSDDEPAPPLFNPINLENECADAETIFLPAIDLFIGQFGYAFSERTRGCCKRQICSFSVETSRDFFVVISS
jgi:hypothetical protein